MGTGTATKTETVTYELGSAEQTARLAAAIAPDLQAGDVLLLSGSIGAGKTHFARALIQARLAHEDLPVEDVPSPTFTLVQTYELTDVDIWHADLYRLTHPDEVDELGLTDAFQTAICIVEWPDRLGTENVGDAIRLDFKVIGDDARRLTVTGDMRELFAKAAEEGQ